MRAGIRWGGTVPLEDIVAHNDDSGEKFKDAVVDMADTLKKQVSYQELSKAWEALTYPSIQQLRKERFSMFYRYYYLYMILTKHSGARAHYSTMDPSDKKKVITVSFYNAHGTILMVGHAHEDGAFKHWPKGARKK